MEHLLPPGIKAPFRIPCYQQRPDINGKIDSVDDYAPLFEATVKVDRSTFLENASAAFVLWLHHCRIAGGYNLCFALLDQLYFRALHFILGPDVVLANFVERDEDGSVFLTTAVLENYLLAWKEWIAALDDNKKVRLNQQIKVMLEQASAILTHLGMVLAYLYVAQLPVAADGDYYDYDKDPVGKTHFACVLLVHALTQACQKVLRVDNRIINSHALHVQWLTRKMGLEGWCPYTIFKLENTCRVDGMP